jgi:hypothetical protein
MCGCMYESLVITSKLWSRSESMDMHRTVNGRRRRLRCAYASLAAVGLGACANCLDYSRHYIGQWSSYFILS